MQFEFDRKKHEALLAERNIDFRYVLRIFNGPTLEADDRRSDYGERRRKAIGVVDSTHYVVIYTDRDDIRRLITAWRAGRRDRDRYDAWIAEQARSRG